MARITFEIKDTKHKMFKAAVAREGLQMSDVLREFVGSYSLTEPNVSTAQVIDLVAASRALVNSAPPSVFDMAYPDADGGIAVDGKARFPKFANALARARVALAPFDEEPTQCPPTP